MQGPWQELTKCRRSLIQGTDLLAVTVPAWCRNSTVPRGVTLPGRAMRRFVKLSL
jgi:hypothetical protein